MISPTDDGVEKQLGYEPDPEHVDEYRCVICGKPIPTNDDVCDDCYDELNFTSFEL